MDLAMKVAPEVMAIGYVMEAAAVKYSAMNVAPELMILANVMEAQCTSGI